MPVLFAILGPAEYGRWALLYGIAAGVPQVTTSWLEATVIRFGHRRERRARGWSIAVATAGSIWLSAVSAAVFVPRSSLFDLLSAATLTTVVSLYVLAIARLQSAMAFGAISIVASVRAILGALLTLVGALVTGQAWVAITGLAGGYAVGQILGYLIRRRAEPASTLPIRADVTAPEERLTYGLASGLGAVASYTLSVGDRFILSALRPLAEVGSYAATYAMMDLASRFVPSIVLTAMRPRAFRAWDRGARVELGTALTRLAAVLAWAVAAAAFVLMAGALLIGRLPIELALGGPIAIGFACFMAASSLGLAYSGATRQGRLAGHLTVGAVANIGLNLLLIPAHGALGAAIATAGSYALLLVLNVVGLTFAVRLDRMTAAVALAAGGSLLSLTVAGATGQTFWFFGLALMFLLVASPQVVKWGQQLRRLE